MNEKDETGQRQQDPPLPQDVCHALSERGLSPVGEVALRRALEQHVPGYSLYRLPPAAVKRWKVRYRLMAGASYYDGQSAAEAYARALLACVAGASCSGADGGPLVSWSTMRPESPSTHST